MILHLISDEKFIDHVIYVFEKVSPENNIYLLPNNNKDLKYVKSKNKNLINTTENSSKYKTIINSINTFDGIIIHNLYDEYKKKILLLIKEKKQKIYVHWMSWGTDLYFIPQLSSKLIAPVTKKIVFNKNIPISLLRIQNLIQDFTPMLWDRYSLFQGNTKGYYNYKNIISTISSFSTIIPSEIQLIQKYFNLAPEQYVPFKYEIIDNRNEVYSNEICINNNFLVGNSATVTNNHLDAFGLINKWALSNSKVIVPLSYGDNNYANIVINKGTKLFGNNFIPINDFLSKNEFNKLLNNCGNVIMNHHRQQALGTIIISLWKGARVYLDHHNPLNDFFRNNGIKTFLLKDIKNINHLPEFSELANINRPKLLNLFNEKNVLSETKSLIERIKAFKYKEKISY